MQRACAPPHLAPLPQLRHVPHDHELAALRVQAHAHHRAPVLRHVHAHHAAGMACVRARTCVWVCMCARACVLVGVATGGPRAALLRARGTPLQHHCACPASQPPPTSPLSTATHSPARKSHSRTTASRPSCVLAISAPSAQNATAHTNAVWPRKKRCARSPRVAMATITEPAVNTICARARVYACVRASGTCVLQRVRPGGACRAHTARTSSECGGHVRLRASSPWYALTRCRLSTGSGSSTQPYAAAAACGGGVWGGWAGGRTGWGARG